MADVALNVEGRPTITKRRRVNIGTTAVKQWFHFKKRRDPLFVLYNKGKPAKVVMTLAGMIIQEGEI